MSETSPKLAAGLLAAPAPLTMIVLVTILLMTSPGSNRTGAPPASATGINKDAQVDETPAQLPMSAALQVLSDYQSHRFKVNSLAHTGANASDSDAATATNLFNCMEALKELKEATGAAVGGVPGLQCVIALVPDPIDSHFPLTFDNAISSIHQAFGDHGFVRDRQLLLWQYGLKKDKDAKASDRSAPWRNQPSAILFRKTRPDPTDKKSSSTAIDTDLVLVLLVGETPTAGVQRPAFINAVEFVVANQLSAHSDAGQLDIPIIGPTFSGTSASLQSTLSLWWPEFDKRMLLAQAPRHERKLTINFVSGSATSASNINFLGFDLPGEKQHHFKSTFQATVLPDSITKELLVKHLVENIGIRANRIALLTEDTSYGQSKRKSENSTPTELEQVRSIPFPLSLSRMRSEYQKSEKATPGNNDSVAAKINVQRRNVTLDTESAQQATDAIPTFSSVTPAIADLALARILETIKQDEIQAVGIVATDVQDVLFLARQVRMFSPDVLLFTTENEVLYTHSDLAGYLRGMLVASTYPLSTRVKNWFAQAGTHPTDLAFPSSSAQGIYNATIAQLNGLTSTHVPLRGYHMPLAESKPELKLNDTPPLWLSVVTETGIWPVAVKSVDDLLDGSPNDAASKRQEVVKVARNYVLKETRPEAISEFALVSVSRVPSLCFALAGALIIGLMVLRQGIRPKNSWINTWLARNLLIFAELDKPLLTEVQFNRQVVIVMTILGVALIECLLISPLLMYWTTSLWLPGSLALSLGRYISPLHAVADLTIFALCLVVLITILGITIAYFVQLVKFVIDSPSDGTRFIKVGMLIVLGMALVLVTVIGLRPFFAHARELALFVDRAGELSSGVSPIMPMVAMIIAILVWSVGHWSRSYLIEESRLESPIAGEACTDGQTKETFLNFATADLGRKLGHLKQSTQYIHHLNLRKQDMLFCALVAMNVLYVFFHWVTTFEGRYYDFVFMVLCWVALAMFLILYLHLKTVCQRMLALLRALAQHPILPAFQRAPQRLRDKVSEQLFCKLPNTNDMNQKMRQFDRACQVLYDATELALAVELQEKFCASSYNTTGDGQSAECPAPVPTEPLAFNKHRWQSLCSFNTELAGFSRDFIVPKLTQYWLSQERADELKSDGQTAKPLPRKFQAAADAELYLAIELLSILRCTFVFMRGALIALVGMLLCFMVTLQSYPFVIHTTIQSSLTWITCWVAVSLIFLMVQFNRNEVLSRIAIRLPTAFNSTAALSGPC